MIVIPVRQVVPLCDIVTPYMHPSMAYKVTGITLILFVNRNSFIYGQKYPEQYLWEGIGISSYLLINFWFTRIQANKSAIKALTVNRVGDMFLSVAFFAMFFVFGNLDYATVFSISPFINENIVTIIGLLLLLAAMGKSAQIGLHTWLPDKTIGIMSTYYFPFQHIKNMLFYTTFASQDEKGP